MSNTQLTLEFAGAMFAISKNNPTYYIRDDKFIDNTYTHDAHPNSGNTYKKGQSKGRMIGYEEAGWLGCRYLYTIQYLPF